MGNQKEGGREYIPETRDTLRLQWHFLETLNTACVWRKQSTKKNILCIANVVTFEATTDFWGMEY